MLHCLHPPSRGLAFTGTCPYEAGRRVSVATWYWEKPLSGRFACGTSKACSISFSFSERAGTSNGTGREKIRAASPEILAYANHIAEPFFDLRQHIPVSIRRRHGGPPTDETAENPGRIEKTEPAADNVNREVSGIMAVGLALSAAKPSRPSEDARNSAGPNLSTNRRNGPHEGVDFNRAWRRRDRYGFSLGDPSRFPIIAPACFPRWDGVPSATANLFRAGPGKRKSLTPEYRKEPSRARLIRRLRAQKARRTAKPASIFPFQHEAPRLEATARGNAKRQISGGLGNAAAVSCLSPRPPTANLLVSRRRAKRHHRRVFRAPQDFASSSRDPDDGRAACGPDKRVRLAKRLCVDYRLPSRTYNLPHCKSWWDASKNAHRSASRRRASRLTALK